MKKLFLLAVMAVFAVSVSAQTWGVGVTAGYGSEIGKPSIGVKANWELNETFTVSPSFNYYFKDTEKASVEGYTAEADLQCWELNADLHWNLVKGDNYVFYPFAGISYMNAKATSEVEGFKASVSDGEIGVNLGAGIQYNFSETWALTGEAKYQLGGFDQFVINVGVMYRF